MFARVRKAVVAGVAAGITALVGAAVQNGSVTLGLPQLLTALGAAIVAGLAVYRVPNTPTPPAGVTGTYVGNK